MLEFMAEAARGPLNASLAMIRTRIPCYPACVSQREAGGRMANLTLTIDDEALEKARMHALHRGTSVRALVREYLQSLANGDAELETSVAGIDAIADSGAGHGYVVQRRPLRGRVEAPMKVFVDTNVLLYRFDHDAPKKQEAARSALRRSVLECCILLSTQVLQAFYVAATRKLKRLVAPDRAASVVDHPARRPVAQVGPSTIPRAIARPRGQALSFRDALIVETASEAGAHRISSEDLQDGQDFGGVTVARLFLISSPRM